MLKSSPFSANWQKLLCFTALMCILSATTRAASVYNFDIGYCTSSVEFSKTFLTTIVKLETKKVEVKLNVDASIGSAIMVEICDNGIDDDGDGLIDQFDDDCPCDGTVSFYGNCLEDCVYVPSSSASSFSIANEWESAVETMDINQVLVGDLDGAIDKVPEIIVLEKMAYSEDRTNAIYILDGKDGTLKYRPNTLRIDGSNKGFAIADADADGRAEFYYIVSDDDTSGNNRRIACYEYNPDGTNPAGSGIGTFDLQWVSSTRVTCGLTVLDESITEDFPVALADFNYDGIPEVYVGNEIFNSADGVFIANGGINSFGSWNNGEYLTSFHNNAITVAVDALPDDACANCQGLELVAGNQVYSVDVATGTMAVEQQAPILLTDGSTAVADYDLDGDLDAIITSNTILNTFLYVWDIQTNTQIGGTHIVSTSSSLTYHPINLPIIADFDGDDMLEIGVVAQHVLQIVDDYTVDITGTGGVLWSQTTVDVSGQTGVSVFDFNGDGVSEVVYRDQDNLRIMSGEDGTDLATFACSSKTGAEYAVVVDVDNDDQTEIVCNCDEGGVTRTKVFRSDGTPWLRSRTLWNQYAYFNVNVNEDLTIPRQQQNHNQIGSPAVGVSSVTNNFLQQSPILDEFGNVDYSAPDLSLASSVDATDCISANTIDLEFSITNSGAASAPNGTPIAIYDSNPTSSSANLIGTALTPLIAADVTEDIVYTLDVSTVVFPTILYVVVNDDGSVARPYTMAANFPTTFIGECDFDNNMIALALDSRCEIYEICDNGIDDDFDGFIDCLDKGCPQGAAVVRVNDL